MILEVVEGMRQFLMKHGISINVIKSSIPVAPLATIPLLAKDLGHHFKVIKEADLVIIPGLVRGAASELERVLGVPVIKGTAYAGDLPRLIKLIVEGGVDVNSLKGSDPADVVIGRMLEEELGALLKAASGGNHLFRVRGVVFKLRPPPLNLFYELCANTALICPSPRLESTETLCASLKSLGYAGLIIGCDLEGCSEDIKEKLALIRDSGLISGIDAYNYPQIDPDVIAEADMLLNIDASSLDSIADKVRSDTILTLIPTSTGSSKEVISSINLAVSRAREYGFERILIDPILKPPMLGLLESIKVLSEVASSVEYPLLAGLCNVYELIDADTPGVIALLTTLLFEAGVSNLLVTEASRKACGAVEEASVARDLVYWAYLRKSPPKDYTHSLLVLKDKRIRQTLSAGAGATSLEKASVIIVDKFVKPRMDNKYLKIHIDYRGLKLVVDVYCGRRLLARYAGNDPLSLGRVVSRNERLSAEHSLYLGFELCKAYSALKLLKEYIQDEELFKSIYIRNEYPRKLGK